MAEDSNTTKLRNAGILKADQDLAEHEHAAIDALPAEDVDALVRVHQKMSGGSQGPRLRALGII